jgi:hypothetical protein
MLFAGLFNVFVAILNILLRLDRRRYGTVPTVTV